MKIEKRLFALTLTAGIGCSHSLPQDEPPRSVPAPPSCYRPAAEPFRSILPADMTPEEGRAKAIVGALEKDDIQRVIQRNIHEVQSCFERGLVRQPHLSGRVRIQFIVVGNGAVSDSRLDLSTLDSPATEACVAEQPCKWRFPPTTGGGPVIVTYPFELKQGP